ncbi:MAG TPA: hypothetical protein VFN67_08420 [Polyangiales bacterium]|nr:hypothetical protein [Polyangiales bacterium]
MTEKDVDAWKGTRKGPGKMVAVMLADKFDMPLRVYAALELVEMERQDVDGVTEMQHAIQKLEPETRAQITEGLADGLIALMKKPAEPSKEDENDDKKPEPALEGAPPPHQVRAKDAAFVLVSSAPPAVRERLTQALVQWYTVDFNGRSLTGNFSAEQVVRGLGSSAARSLVDALDAKLPTAALIKLSELTGQLGDADARKRAGQRLVAIEREMEGPAFLNWLKQQITGQMKAGSQQVDAARVAKAAEINRENFINNGALPAMKYLADQPDVQKRLLEIAALKDAKLTDRRTRALQALEGKLGPEHVDEVLSLALNNQNPVSVRDYAFDRVGDTRNPKALASLWPLLQDDDQRLRWRAGELILVIGGTSVLSEFFSKLPGGANVSYEPEELDGYAQRMSQMTPAPKDAAKAQLESPNWWLNVIGLDYFQRKGTDSDVAAMEPLTHNATPVKGKRWEKGDTLGKVAERAIAGLRERLKEAAGASGSSSGH